MPPSVSERDNIVEEITGLGSAWEQLRYFRAKVIKSEAGGKGRRGPFSTRNDAWVITSKCGDSLYLRTHPEDNLKRAPLSLQAATEHDELPSCLPCPKGANCRGSRTWSQVESLPGFRPLPWDDRGYGKCPRPPACPGSDNMMVLNESTFLWNGGNSTRDAETCNSGHRGILCAECNHWFDTKLGDQLGLCVMCPDQSQNYWRLGGLAVVGVLMMSFLVGDSLHGIKKIVNGVAQGDDVAVPFHSVGIRIISSYMQVAGLLNNFRLDLPPAVTSLVTAQSAASGVGGAVISFNCLMPESRGQELFMTRLVTIVIVIPVGCLVSVVVFWGCVQLCCWKDLEPIQTVHGHIYKHAVPKDKMIGSIVVLFYLMFPSILNGITTAMSCTTYGEQDSGISRILLDGALSIECYKDVHLLMLAMVLAPAFGLFAVIMPVLVVMAMRLHFKRKTLLPHQENFNPVACYRYGFLFLGYEEENYGWEVLVMIRKAAFVVAAGLLRPYGPVAQVVGASIILILCLSLQLQIRPYDSKGHDHMESTSIHCSLMILMCVLLASIVGQDTTGKLGPISSVVLIIVVFGATFFFFTTAWTQVMTHSHTNQGLLGIVARRTTRASKMDRRHTINFDIGDLTIPPHSSSSSSSSSKEKGGKTSVVPQHRRKNKIGGPKRGLTMSGMRSLVVEENAVTLEKESARHSALFKKSITQRATSAHAKTQLRLQKRLRKKVTKKRANLLENQNGGKMLSGAMRRASEI